MLSKTKCRLGANRETSLWKDDPLNFYSLITASKWTSCNAEWQNKIRSLCLNTVAGYSEEALSILWAYHSYAYQYLLALVALISRWIQNFRRTAGLTSSAFPDWSIEQSVSVSFLGQLQTGCKWLRTKYTKIHLSTEWDRFFPENWTDFLFQELPEEIQSKILYVSSVINEYSLRGRDVHSTPSWHKWSDFEYRPWCLAIVVRKPPGRFQWKERLKRPCSRLFKTLK